MKKILITSLASNDSLIPAIKELRQASRDPVTGECAIGLKEAKEIMSRPLYNLYGAPVPVEVEVHHVPEGEHLNYKVLADEISSVEALRRTIGLIKLMDYDIEKIEDLVELLDLTYIKDLL